MHLSRQKWMWSSLLMTFVVGMCLGIVLDRLVLDGGNSLPHARDERRQRLLAKLTEELELDEEQRRALERTITANRDRADAFWEESRKEFEALREAFRQDIRAILNDRQREKFDELAARRDNERQKGRAR